MAEVTADATTPSTSTVNAGFEELKVIDDGPGAYTVRFDISNFTAGLDATLRVRVPTASSVFRALPSIDVVGSADNDGQAREIGPFLLADPPGFTAALVEVEQTAGSPGVSIPMVVVSVVP